MVKKSTFCLVSAIRPKFGGWGGRHQMDTNNNTPYAGVGPKEARGWGRKLINLIQAKIITRCRPLCGLVHPAAGSFNQVWDGLPYSAVALRSSRSPLRKWSKKSPSEGRRINKIQQIKNENPPDRYISSVCYRVPAVTGRSGSAGSATTPTRVSTRGSLRSPGTPAFSPSVRPRPRHRRPHPHPRRRRWGWCWCDWCCEYVWCGWCCIAEDGGVEGKMAQYDLRELRHWVGERRVRQESQSEGETKTQTGQTGRQMKSPMQSNTHSQTKSQTQSHGRSRSSERQEGSLSGSQRKTRAVSQSRGRTGVSLDGSYVQEPAEGIGSPRSSASKVARMSGGSPRTRPNTE